MRSFGSALLIVMVSALFAPSAAGAHESEPVGDVNFTFGWRDEPTYAGLPNAVFVSVADDDGSPVDDPGARLSVTVWFGDASTVRPLVPREEPGAFEALLVPTQAGTYGFQITGTLDGEAIDIESTCSDTTFDCVVDSAEVEFPGSASASADTITSTSASESDSDSSALTILALALSTLALIGLVAMFLGTRRTKGPA